jgi:hypothetical protein
MSFDDLHIISEGVAVISLLFFLSFVARSSFAGDTCVVWCGVVYFSGMFFFREQECCGMVRARG